MQWIRFQAIFIAALLLGGAGHSGLADVVKKKGEIKELVVYSARNEQLIKPLFDAYQQETGVRISFVTGEAGPLIQRLKAEGEKTPADLFIAVDAGNLWQAAREGLLRPVSAGAIRQNIPEHLRDSQGRWFGLSVRARTMVYNPKKVKPEELSNYENLGDPKWKGRLCLRTSKKVYNQSLVATLIHHLGGARATQVVKGWVRNLATDVFANDTQVIEAVAAGQCDVGIVNTYYYGRLLQENPALSAKLFWANQKNRGVHLNISGGGVVTHAKHPEEALRFLEWLSSPKAQNLFADVNHEYPANPSVKPSPLVAEWGVFKEDRLNVSQAGELQGVAIKLIDKAGYR